VNLQTKSSNFKLGLNPSRCNLFFEPLARDKFKTGRFIQLAALAHNKSSADN
jgi:hypothetical protein